MHDVYFTRFLVVGLDVDAILAHYLDWVLGHGEFARLRQRRVSLGIAPAWTPADLAPGGAFRAEGGARIDVVRGAETAIRLSHPDDRDSAVSWISVGRFGAAGGAVLVSHGVGREIPRGMRLEPVAAAPAVITALLERGGTDVDPDELHATAAMTLDADAAAAFARSVLLAEGRALPVAVIGPGRDDIEPARLARALRGVARVAVLASEDAADALGDTLEDATGQELDCPDGGARLYFPLISEAPEWSAADIARFPQRRRTTALAAEMIGDVTARTLPDGFFEL